MADVNRRFTAALVQGMERVLRPAGFRKHSQLFQRGLNDIVHLVQLQKSMSSTSTLVRATVNLAVWVPVLAAHGDRPSVAAAQCRARLGGVMPCSQDAWWEISTDAEAEASELSIAGALKRFGLPWLNAIDSTSALIELWESGQAPGLTARQRVRLLQQLLALRGPNAEGPWAPGRDR